MTDPTPPSLPPAMDPEAQRVAIAEGQRFGRLVALERTRQTKSRNWVWLCACDCGNVKEVTGSDLRNGHTKSCGCYRRDATAQNKTVHGAAKRGGHTREYRIWRGMISRCHSPTNAAYSHYGARDIFVCDSWRYSFANFLADMGPCPAGLSIDRINNKLGYGPDNCRWATAKQQANNRSKRRWKKKP